MIIINPEFHRNLWLNFSPFRLAIMPVLLTMIIYIFSSKSGVLAWQEAIFLPAFGTYCLVVFLWGNYEAASTSAKDVGHNTWDFQKMSAISPWELTIGKLFGPTSYVWYSGGLLLTVLAFSYSFTSDLSKLKEIHDIYQTPIIPIIYLVFAGVMGHACALLFSLDSLKRKGNPSFILPFISGIMTSCSILYLAFFADLKNHLIPSQEPMNWNGLKVDPHMFVICSLIYFSFWTLMAIQRNLRAELQYKNSPAVLMIFLVTVCIYFSGFVDNTARDVHQPNTTNILIVKMWICFLILMACTYSTMFMEANNPAKYTRWFYAIKHGEWKRIAENMPAWLGVCVLLIPVYLAVITIRPEKAADLVAPVPFRHLTPFYLTTVLMLFTVRDGLILHSILGGKIEKHKSFVIALYYLLIYGLIPFIMTSFFAKDEETIRRILQTFYPIGGNNLLHALAPVLIQVLLACLVLRFSLKRK